MSRRISAKELAQDVNDGMHRNALMNKYGISPGQLDALIEKLRTAGLIVKAEPPPEPSHQSPEDEPGVCLVCGLPLPEPVEVCPRCGVVLSKVKGGSPPSETEHEAPFPAQQQTRSVMPRPWSMPVVFAALAGIIVLLVATLVLFMGDGSSRQDAQAGRSRAPDDYPYKNIPAPPSVREINPAVDREMRKGLRDLDRGLSQRREAVEQSGEE